MIGSEIRQQVFRNTTRYYLQASDIRPNRHLLRFAARHAGPSVLDIGCATGVYSLALKERGFQVTGVDINEAYLDETRRKGVPVLTVDEASKLADGTFDTVLLFEVLEHLDDPAAVMREAARLARKNVLVSVPHCGDVAALQRCGLMYEHFADEDHRNFFTVESLTALLAPFGRACSVKKGDPFLPHVLMPPSVGRRIVQLLGKTGLLTPQFYNRLYAVVSIA